ncbi:unnamed protein product [Heterosigma akashiwo]
MAFTADSLVLDPQIRDWVVLPLVYLMVLMGALRHYIQQMLKSDKQIDKEEVGCKQTLLRASRLRRAGGLLSPDAFLRRKAYFVLKDKGVLHAEVKGAANPMANPMGMVDMMKNNMTFLISNVTMMTFISFFFSGFVLVRVPFPLTMRFKVMLQRGVELSTLDASYVSSLSWYFLVMFGLRSFLTLFLGEGSADADDKAMAMQMGMGMGGGGPMGFDAKKAYKQEREALELAQYKDALADVEKRVLGPRYALLGRGL